MPISKGVLYKYTAVLSQIWVCTGCVFCLKSPRFSPSSAVHHLQQIISNRGTWPCPISCPDPFSKSRHALVIRGFRANHEVVTRPSSSLLLSPHPPRGFNTDRPGLPCRLLSRHRYCYPSYSVPLPSSPWNYPVLQKPHVVWYARR